MARRRRRSRRRRSRRVVLPGGNPVPDEENVTELTCGKKK